MRKGYCFPSQELLAKDMGVTSRSVRSALTQLEEHGIIKIKKAEGFKKLMHQNDTYFFKDHPLWKVKKIKQSEVVNSSGDDPNLPTGKNFRSVTENTFHSNIRESYIIDSCNTSLIKPKEVLSAPSERGTFRKIPRGDDNPLIEQSRDPLIEKEMLTAKIRSNPSTIEGEHKAPTILERLAAQEAEPLDKNGGRVSAAPTSEEPPKGGGVKVRKLSRNGETILALWNIQPHLRKHHTSRNGGVPKNVLQADSYIKELLKGQAFSNTPLEEFNRSFTIEEIQGSIKMFEIISSSPEYPPSNKNMVKNLGLNQFIYNPFAKCKSWFLKCLSEQKPLVESRIQEHIKPYYDSVVKAWINYAGNGREFTLKEKEQLLTAAQALYQTQRRMNGKIQYMLDHVKPLGPALWAEWLVESLLEKFEDISVGSLCCNFAFESALPDYLRGKGRLSGSTGEETGYTNESLSAEDAERMLKGYR
jgi:hypothetical protein